jgi:hypothetical protein
MLGFFPVVVSTVVGFKSVDPDMLDLARSMKASRLATFCSDQPAAGATLDFAGLKVSVTLAVVGAVVGEFVGSNSGIGYLLQIANGNFDLPLMFAALTVLSAIGVLLFVAGDACRALDDSRGTPRSATISPPPPNQDIKRRKAMLKRFALWPPCWPAFFRHPQSRRPKTKPSCCSTGTRTASTAPFYLGKERGYFDQEGIDLDIQEGRGSA